MGFDNELIINNIEDVRNYKASTLKIEKELNYKAAYTVIDSLNDILDNININDYNFNDEIFYNIETFKKVVNEQ